MGRELNISRDLNQFRSIIDDMIERGEFDSFPNRRPDMHQINSIICSDLKAALSRKAAGRRSGNTAEREVFEAMDLKEVAVTEGRTLEVALQKSYVRLAENAEKGH